MNLMLELVAKSLTQDDPMDSIQVGKAVFVKESYTTLGIEPRTYSNPGRSGNHYSINICSTFEKSPEQFSDSPDHLTHVVLIRQSCHL